MTVDAASLVPKRLTRAALALLCLAAAQGLLASCEPEPTPMAARIARP